jgi:hypothetical protein
MLAPAFKIGRWDFQQQLEVVQNNPSPARLAEKTVEYAKAKTAYCQALRAAMPELINIATGRQARPPELDKFAAIFAIAGEKQETVADQKTVIFLKRFLPNPDVEKAEVEFERAQKVEEPFHSLEQLRPAPKFPPHKDPSFHGARVISRLIHERRLSPLCRFAARGRPVDEAGHRASTL